MRRSRPHCPGAKRPGVAQRDEPLDLSAAPATVSGMLTTASGTACGLLVDGSRTAAVEIASILRLDCADDVAPGY
jgi:hypothetical protein